MIKERNVILEELKSNLCKAQNRMKRQADKKRREVEFGIGEYVFLKLQPYRFLSLTSRPNKKLSPHFYEPYEILERVGQVAYRLKLLETTKIHPIFHVLQLKRHLG